MRNPNLHSFQSYPCGNAKEYVMLFVGQLYYNFRLPVSHKCPVRASRMHVVYLLLNSFPACSFRLRQNYQSQLETLQLSIYRGKSGGLSNSFKIVYEPLLFLCSWISNGFLEHNKPKSEPLQRENLLKVTLKMFAATRISVKSVLSQPQVLPSKNWCNRPSSDLSSVTQNPELAQNLRSYQLPQKK